MSKILFFVGTGRCGTHFTAKVFNTEKNVASHHERHPLIETFERYVQWYNLPVDHSGFLNLMGKGINEDLDNNTHSIESSAYLSFSMKELSRKFDAKFVLLTRDPKKMVESYIKKGWYSKKYIQEDSNLALGLQDEPLPHHTFSRFAPKDGLFNVWNNEYSRSAKLSWYWNALNEKVLEDAVALKDDTFRVQKIEEFDYKVYKNICEFNAMG
jgi:hypothetical protein